MLSELAFSAMWSLRWSERQNRRWERGNEVATPPERKTEVNPLPPMSEKERLRLRMEQDLLRLHKQGYRTKEEEILYRLLAMDFCLTVRKLDPVFFQEVRTIEQALEQLEIYCKSEMELDHAT